MTKDEFTDEVQDIFTEFTDEPAGRGAGYGLTDKGFNMLNRLADTLFKVEETNLKESLMSNKTQELFNWAVIEFVKVKDDNGQVESTKKKVHGSGTALPAFDVENAKLKAMALVTLPEDTDIDEVKVEISNF
jgi:hypothetical protein